MVSSKFKIALLLAVLLAGGLAGAANHPPTLLPIAAQSVYIGEKLTLTLKATDPDGDQVTFSTGSLPANAFLDKASGLFTWAPSIDQIGVTNFVFTATDNNNPARSSSIMVPVRVIFRAIRQEKAWGLGVSPAETLLETSNQEDLFPKISRIEIDGQSVGSFKQLDISTAPRLVLNITSLYNIDRDNLSVTLDGTEIKPLEITNVQTLGQERNIVSLAIEIRPSLLSAGQHTLAIRSGNSLGFSTQSIVLNAGALRVTDAPMPFPSPFAPGNGNLTLQYSLSQNSDIEILIIGSNGQMITRLDFLSGAEGGRVGLNKISWNGRSNNGMFAGNGIYIAAIIGRETRQILSKAKLTLYK